MPKITTKILGRLNSAISNLIMSNCLFYLSLNSKNSWNLFNRYYVIIFVEMITKKVNIFYDNFYHFLLYAKIRFGETQI